MLGQRIKVLLETTRRLSRRGAFQPLTKILSKTHNADIAVLFRFYDERERRRIFTLFTDLEQRAQLISELDVPIAVELLSALEIDETVTILQEMESDDSADIIAEMPEDLAADVLARMVSEESEVVETLLGFREDSAGGIMNTNFFALDKDCVAGAAISALQKAEDVDAFYLYVLNEYGHLVGVMSLRTLVTTPPDMKLREMMIPDVISVTPETDQEEVARLVARYNFLALPVVDESNKMLGIVTVDDVIDVITEEATKDMLQMAGAGEELPESQSSVWQSVRTRFPWLLMTCCGGIVAALLIRQLIDGNSLLAFLLCFVPLLLGMARNVGNQSTTLIVRSLGTGQIDVTRFGFWLFRELAVGVVSGLMYGVLIGGVAILMYSTPWHGVAIAVSLVASMFVSTLIGTLIPIMIGRMNIDPTRARSPLTMSLMDILSVVIFVVLAQTLIKSFG